MDTSGIAVTDQHDAARSLFKHEREILRAHEELGAVVYILFANQISRDTNWQTPSRADD
jgi:hypothetical protein